ncbi:putative metallopeptidase [Castellaniella ginsengisoli]|uniref:Metallopeptidase n=1 Tax=Castellaniella ginsengisoli TaxID=546114 RepID=A0AB39D2U0_9BURK
MLRSVGLEDRPAPPQALPADYLFDTVLAPAPDLDTWVQENILSEDGSLHNPDHAHLIDADIGFLWASSAFTKRGRTVVGQAEQVMIRAGGWQKARQEQQLREWFGHVPEFLITLAADYCAQCSDTEFCALVEHELYHIGQEQDEFGAPKFTKDGMPRLAMRGHDVEEFVGVVQRYGASAQVARMVEAAKHPPAVSGASIAHACGTCLRAAA